jgi:hypothetical protein
LRAPNASADEGRDEQEHGEHLGAQGHPLVVMQNVFKPIETLSAFAELFQIAPGKVAE